MTLRGLKFILTHYTNCVGIFFSLSYSSCHNILLHLLDGCTLVALVPPGLGRVQVATPQLPVEALG